MKTKNLLLKQLAVFGLCLGTLVSGIKADTYVPNAGTGTARVFSSDLITENFSSFTGASGGSDLPTGFFVSAVEGGGHSLVFHGSTDFTSITPPDSDSSSVYGFWSAYNSTNTLSRALTMIEEGGSGLADARLYLKFQNNAGSIQGVHIKYDIQQWVDGKRINEVRLRYSPTITFSSSLDEAATVAELANATSPSIAVDGNVHSDNAEAFVIFPSVLSTSTPGYLRWAFGTASGSGDRDALGLANLWMEPIYAGTPATWGGSGFNWTNGGAFNGSINWANRDGNNNVRYGATLSSTASITITNEIETTNLYATESTTVIGGSNQLAVDGPINVANGKTLTLSGLTFDGVYGIIKNNSGSLLITNVSVTSTAGIAVQQGSLTFGSSVTLPSNAGRLSVGTDATVTLNGSDYTFSGIFGQDTGTVNLGSNAGSTITLDSGASTSAVSHKGALTGTIGTLVKNGKGRQRLRSSAKTFTANSLVVNDGIFEATQNTISGGSSLGNVAAITLTGTATNSGTDSVTLTEGVLLLSNDSTSSQTFRVGTSTSTLTIQGGRLALDSQANMTLSNSIVLGTATNLNRLDVNSNSGVVYTMSGAITGTNGFRKVGGGTVNLTSGSNTFTGTVDLNNGTIIIPSTGSMGLQSGTNSVAVKFTDPTKVRLLEINRTTTTISALEGNSPDQPGTQNATLAIKGNTLVLDQVATATGTGTLTQEIKPSFQGNLTGTSSAVFRKRGTGTTRFTRYAKTFGGSVQVDNGVLQVSNDGAFSATGVTVNTTSGTVGGQLRLSSGGTSSAVIYTFGGPIVLKSTGRSTDATVVSEANFGLLGGLRYDADTGTQLAELTTGVQIAAQSDIHINGTATEKVLTISGPLSGSANFDRTGGGKLVLTNTSSYSGVMNLQNGVTALGAGVTFGGGINLSNATNSSTLAFNGSATIVGDLAVDRGSTDNVIRVVAGQTVAITGVFDISVNWSLDFNNTAAKGITYTVFNSTGTIVTGTIPTILNPPSGTSTTSVTIGSNLLQVRFD